MDFYCQKNDPLLHEGIFINFMKNLKHHITGILGGLGPKTTATFYLDLIKNATSTARPSLCIWSLPLDLEKERRFIEKGTHKTHYLKLLRNGVKALEKAGCTQVVMPCNTVHEFHAELQSITSIPFPHLIEIVATELKRRKWRKVLLLATSRTIRTRLYQDALKSSKIELVLPSLKDQKKLDQIIQGLLTPLDLSKQQDFLQNLIKESGTQKVLLGCTDLQIVLSPSRDVVDSMQCLVDFTARKIREI